MATAQDAELILKLYELRREARMREARNWVMHEFNPKNLEELLAVQRDFGSNENQMWRQVIGYWEMAAALVLHGTLDRELFFDSVARTSFFWRSSVGSMTNTQRWRETTDSCRRRGGWWPVVSRPSAG